MRVNAADLTAKAYGRRKPRYPVIPETMALAIMLIFNRNNTPEQAVWLVHPGVDDALCEPAEAFASTLEERPSPDGWRGGALASLRTLAGDGLHETTEQWQTMRDGAPPASVPRFWLDDAGRFDLLSGRTSPIRAALLRRLAGHPRMEDAWQAMLAAWNREPRYGERQFSAHRVTMAGWGNLHERPIESEWLHSQLLSRDPEADRKARYEAMFGKTA